MTGPAPITLKVDTKGLERAFSEAPSSVYYWLRSALRGVLISHRTGWLATKGTSFGRGGAGNSRAIRVFKLDEAPAGVPQDNWVVYEVFPREKRVQNPGAARTALTQLTAAIHAGSIVLKVHQEGPQIRSDWMSIPVRTRPGSPAAWRAKNPGKELILRPSRKNADTLMLFERTRTRGRGRPRKDGSSSAKLVERLRLRFLLRRNVQMRPTLRFYESWDAGNQERTRQLRFAADRILTDLAKGVVT